MPVLSGLRPKAAPPREPTEESWAGMVSAMLSDQEALDKYSRAGVRRAADFELSRIAPLWRKLLYE